MHLLSSKPLCCLVFTQVTSRPAAGAKSHASGDGVGTDHGVSSRKALQDLGLSVEEISGADFCQAEGMLAPVFAALPPDEQEELILVLLRSGVCCAPVL